MKVKKDMSLSKLSEIVKDREGWSRAVHGVAKSQTRLRDFTFFVGKVMLCNMLSRFVIAFLPMSRHF